MTPRKKPAPVLWVVLFIDTDGKTRSWGGYNSRHLALCEARAFRTDEDINGHTWAREPRRIWVEKYVPPSALRDGVGR